jgi:hypothetical protein
LIPIYSLKTKHLSFYRRQYCSFSSFHSQEKEAKVPKSQSFVLEHEVFETIIVGGSFLIFLFQQPTLIFSKTFLPLKNRSYIKKQIKKKLDTSEVMAEKQVLTNPLGKRRHLFHFQHKPNAKEILRKISLEQKLQLIEN